ncbi:hypothetical protein PENTCL1PPCAC_26604, partial [Pristionchus entomophagus]
HLARITMSTSLFIFLLLISPSFSYYHRWNDDEQEKEFIDDSPLTKILISEGLIRKPETGHPRVICMARNGTDPVGVMREKECFAKPQHQMNSVGCFALWDEEGYLYQNCVYQQDHAFNHESCQKNKCERSRDIKGVNLHYCCCYGERCNEHPTTTKELFP